MGLAIKNWQREQGLSDEEAAAFISERLDKAVSPAGYRIVKGRKNEPDEWLELLGIAPNEPAPVASGVAGEGSGDTGAMGRTSPSVSILPFEPQSARMTLVIIYTAAGKGAAMGTRKPQVAELWAQAAPQIADAYIEWAKTNSTVAGYIKALTLGGPAGIVVMLHAQLILGTLMAAGAIDAQQMVPPHMRRTPEPTDVIIPDDEGEGDDGVGDAEYGAQQEYPDT